MAFRIELLASKHEREMFHCGTDALDHYLRSQATQDMRRRMANCFVACPGETQTVAGYYMLSATSIPLMDVPLPLAKRLPRYPVLPAVRLGRLAVDRDYTGRGLGSAMLFDAMSRAARAEVAAFALLVDAKPGAEPFYVKLGFRSLASRTECLFLPLASVLT